MERYNLYALIQPVEAPRSVQNHLGEEVQAKEIKSLEKAFTVDIEGIDILSVIVIQ